jgi:hypothetical protein
MAIKLGNTDASLYLGSTPVAAYLGAVQVYSASAPLYFNAAVDGDWATVGNWWLDDEHTQAAGRLPAAADSVYGGVAVTTNSGSAPTVSNLTWYSGDGENSYLGVNVTVSGIAVFSSYGALISATVTGNATFDDYAQNIGTVTGNATFNASSQNNGTVTGNATFSDGASNAGTVTGTATFTGSACNNGGTAGTFVPDPPPSC